MTRVFTATVKDGVIVPGDVVLPEGATVTVVVQGTEPDDYDELTEAELAELDEAIAEADRGEGVSWASVRAELRGPA